MYGQTDTQSCWAPYGWGLSEALFNYIKTPAHRHDTHPDSNMRERRNNSSAFWEQNMHVHARVQKKGLAETQTRKYRGFTHMPTANRDRKQAFCRRHKHMVSESAKRWAALDVRAAPVCNLKVSCHFRGAQTHISGGNAVSIRVQNSGTYIKRYFAD